MKKIACITVWLSAAFVLFAQTETGMAQDSVYQKLLQYRIEHDSNYRQLQMQAEIAANKAEKANYTLIGNPGYYSWHFLFCQGVGYLLIIAYVYILVGIKQAGVIFNLAVLKIISPLILASDLHSGERVKAVIKEVLNSYIMIIGMHFLVTLYSFYMIWISNLEISFYIKLMLLVGGAVAVVGAGIYERILGVSGVGSRFSPLQTMYQMKMLTSGIFRNVKNNSVLKGTKSASSKVFKNTFSKDSPYFNKNSSSKPTNNSNNNGEKTSEKNIGVKDNLRRSTSSSSKTQNSTHKKSFNST